MGLESRKRIQDPGEVIAARLSLVSGRDKLQGVCGSAQERNGGARILRAAEAATFLEGGTEPPHRNNGETEGRDLTVDAQHVRVKSRSQFPTWGRESPGP